MKLREFIDKQITVIELDDVSEEMWNTVEPEVLSNYVLVKILNKLEDIELELMDR